MTHEISHRDVCMPPLSDDALVVSAVVVMLSLKRRAGRITFQVFCFSGLDLDPMTFMYKPYSPGDTQDVQI